ncbi:hypothetical protein SKAU_G00066650 [Synaphobranchus kaupii]|uniref:Reverse transcriptase domain-containing protein n=1 Tax=Synaphobranchus kaupii TaxID=118154 RepID=A0A9Q1G7I2_SYNKA|nr:hypothetical protein SKAU_G00066650 [Synaphobranchus kaupii]
MVVMPKAKEKIRLCVDLTHLNKWVRRERFILPAVDQMLAMLTGANFFTKLDATSGFWQVPLIKDSARLTTFITPMIQMLEGCEGAVCHADDILVYAEYLEQHNARLVLKRLRDEGLTLNDKCEFTKGKMMSNLGGIPLTQGRSERS